MRLSRAWLCAGFIGLLACGDDKNSGDTASDFGAEQGTSAEAGVEAGTEAGAEAGTEAGAGETGMATEGGETGQAFSCADFETQEACDAEPDCMSVIGQRYKTKGGGNVPCLEPIGFLDCVPSMACDQAMTWFCQVNNGTAFLVSNGCGPTNTEPCDPPTDSPVDCG